MKTLLLIISSTVFSFHALANTLSSQNLAVLAHGYTLVVSQNIPFYANQNKVCFDNGQLVDSRIVRGDSCCLKIHNSDLNRQLIASTTLTIEIGDIDDADLTSSLYRSSIDIFKLMTPKQTKMVLTCTALKTIEDFQRTVGDYFKISDEDIQAIE